MSKDAAKVQHVDISFIVEGAIALGVAAACGLVGQQRTDILRRFDKDHEFASRMVRLISADMSKAIAGKGDREEDAARFKALVDSIIAEAGKLVARG